MTDWLDRLVELETEINYRTPPPPGEPEFYHRTGRRPLLISAPHGAAHTRAGRIKDEEDYTAGMAFLLAELTGAHALAAVALSSTDPNWAANAPYKFRLAELVHRHRIRFVLDLHGAAAYRDFGIAIGTLHGRSCPPGVILQVLHGHGFGEEATWLSRLDVDETFPGTGADGQETITRFCAETLHVKAAQLEVNAYLRVVRRRPLAAERNPFDGEPEHIRRTVAALADLVEQLIRTRWSFPPGTGIPRQPPA
ncbi:MAG TPA: hypothetical protein PKV95_01850 [Anaerolineaceae bacterium]|nr:hypothetical protein [Anaerolineaceae bacterium]